MITNQAIEELVAKECERYELERSGFIADRQAAIRELVAQTGILPESCSLIEFAEWKERLLNDWYTRR